MSATHELLVKAREVLANGKVVAGIRRDRHGGHCALGAFDEVLYPGHGGLADDEPVAREAVQVLIDVNGLAADDWFSPLGAVAYWSNALVDIGKPEEVIAGFDRAIEATRPEATPPKEAALPRTHGLRRDLHRARPRASAHV